MGGPSLSSNPNCNTVKSSHSQLKEVAKDVVHVNS